jgi:hypothetical protein
MRGPWTSGTSIPSGELDAAQANAKKGSGMKSRQFNARQRFEALELLEESPWGDIGHKLYDFERALALALEAAGDAAVTLWDTEGEKRFGDEFWLTSAQIAELDAELRFAYVARMLHNMAYAYGVTPRGVTVGRSPDADLTSPLAWSDREASGASLCRPLRALNDIAWGMPLDLEGST